MDLSIPDPLADVMKACEVHCVSECCGLDAFSIEADEILAHEDLATPATLHVARDQLTRLRAAVAAAGEFASSDLLNFWGTPADWSEMLDAWEAAIVSALEATSDRKP